MVLVGVFVSIPSRPTSSSAGLNAIPTEVYEAAAVDGASPFQVWWRITLPLLRRPCWWPRAVINIIYVFNSFPIIYTLKTANPGSRTTRRSPSCTKLAFKSAEKDVGMSGGGVSSTSADPGGRHGLPEVHEMAGGDGMSTVTDTGTRGSAAGHRARARGVRAGAQPHLGAPRRRPSDGAGLPVALHRHAAQLAAARAATSSAPRRRSSRASGSCRRSRRSSGTSGSSTGSRPR